MSRPDWPQHLGCPPEVLPDVPASYHECFLSAPDWDGPIWTEPYQRKVRLRYELPFGLGERTEVHVDRRVAASREHDVVEAIRSGTYVDPAYRLCDAVAFAAMLVETAPSPRAARPLGEVGRTVRMHWLAGRLRPLIEDLTVGQMVSRAVAIDAALDAEPFAATTRYVSRHHLRWVLRQLVDLGLAPARMINGLPRLALERGEREVPEDVDFDRVLVALGDLERLAVEVILETLCRPGEYDALEVRDWRPDLGVLVVRASGRLRTVTKTTATASYGLPASLAARLVHALAGRSAGPLLVDARGQHLTEEVLSRRLAEACAATGSLELTLSDLRMIGASRRLAAGEPPQEVQRRLRHTGIVTGERFYLRHVPGRDRAFVDALDRALEASKAADAPDATEHPRAA